MTDEDVDAIMLRIPERWRTRWCGGEYGECACNGCVQVGNRAIIAEEITGAPYVGDPERISESALMKRDAETYTANKITHDAWLSWMRRQEKS